MAVRDETEALADLAQPRVIDDRYELTELVGTGGMAEVWRARDRRLERDVALKLLAGTAAKDPSRRRKIEREARALAATSHPNIVSVYDYGEAPTQNGSPTPYLVMELVDGPDLHRYLAERGPLPVDEARDLMLGVLAGVERAHAAGVVHGDLKPANIFMGSHGPKVGDFGVARILDEETGATTLAATPTFAAPEVLRGGRPAPASDVYSAGGLAYELLAGRAPYEGANGWEVAQKHLEAPVPRIRKVRSDVPPDIDAAITQAMAKDPRRRFADAASFAAALGAPPSAPSAATGATATMPVPAGAGGPEPTQALTRPAPDLRSAVFLGPFAPWWARARRGGSAAVLYLRRSPLALLAVLVLAMLLFAFLLLRGPSEDELVAVPNVQGKFMVDAAKQLRLKGFKADEVSYRPDDSKEPGTVLETIPAAGAEVEPGTEIHIVASARSPRTPAPARGAVTPQQRAERREERLEDAKEELRDEEGGGKGKGKGKD